MENKVKQHSTMYCRAAVHDAYRGKIQIISNRFLDDCEDNATILSELIWRLYFTPGDNSIFPSVVGFNEFTVDPALLVDLKWHYECGFGFEKLMVHQHKLGKEKAVA